MALSTFGELKAALADWMVGHSVAPQLDTFIALAEAEFSRKLRTREMIARSTAAINTQYTLLPTDAVEVKNATVTVGGYDRTLRQITMDQADHRRALLKGGEPEYFVVSGGEIEVVPAPGADHAVELVYFARIPALSADNPTNWLLANWPDLYLNCALAHAQPYLANPQLAAVHRGETDRILEEIRFADTNAQLGASPLIARPRKGF